MKTTPNRKSPTGPRAAMEAPLNFAAILSKAAKEHGLRKTDRTRLQLLASIASRLSRGVEQSDLKVADVTADAGLAHGTFYRYFPDLKSAVDVLIEDFSGFLHGRLAGAREGGTGTRERVKGATLIYTQLFRANTGLMRCLMSLLSEHASFSKSFQSLNREWNMRMASAIAGRRSTGAGETAPSALNLLPTAYALGGMIDEFLTQIYLREDPALSHLAQDEEAVAELLTELWCRAAVPTPTPGA